ncbi:uncharacterized protein LOC108267283 isoform X2 [Ictalurus punctatus]|uniref:Uncharacterized protein LOC108267283 isoform X2 n=1 Tax=Ictalurus punctatus TaxID=7998 RepID=A0A2D0RAC0_ICTPU|nr:uncharacterized protein LOC108267283 isoform X2 [Ictalurus punctatus]
MLQIVTIQLICMVVCFHQVRGEDKRSVIGYVNESVVLSSYVDPSWTLKNIQWTIFKNDTLIATFENNVKRVDRWPQFNGRLELNTTSGHLTINNLTANDSMEYSTHLEGQGTKEPKINKVQLFVREQFPKPNITLLHSFLDAGKCVISLKCSSLSSNISLMWTSEERLWSDSANVTKESVTWTSSLNREAKFFCIATDGNRNMLNQLSVKCPEPKTCTAYICWVSLIIILILFIIIIIAILHYIKSVQKKCKLETERTNANEELDLDLNTPSARASHC